MSRRESYQSLQQRKKKEQEPGLVWLRRQAEKLEASGDREFTLEHPLVRELGLGEGEMRRMCHGTDCLGMMTMDVVWKDVPPTAHVPSGKVFDHYVWRIG